MFTLRDPSPWQPRSSATAYCSGHRPRRASGASRDRPHNRDTPPTFFRLTGKGWNAGSCFWPPGFSECVLLCCVRRRRSRPWAWNLSEWSVLLERLSPWPFPPPLDCEHGPRFQLFAYACARELVSSRTTSGRMNCDGPMACRCCERILYSQGREVGPGLPEISLIDPKWKCGAPAGRLDKTIPDP